MPSPNDIFTTLYRAYLPEMVEIVIHAYEYYRNLDMPKECVPYKVNRKRYKDEFWKQVIREHIRKRLNPADIILFYRRLCAGQSPWPNLLMKLPGMLEIDTRLQNKLRKWKTSEFSLGCFKGCDTQQKLNEAVKRYRSRNFNISPPTLEEHLCCALIERDWNMLINDPEGRENTARALLKSIEQGGQEKLLQTFQTQLEEFSTQLPEPLSKP